MTMQEKWKRGWELFLFFFKIGFFTFGGGWSMLTQMQNEFVEKRGWMTETELLDITSVGRSLPGLMITNISVLFGYRMAGIPAAILSVLGISLPSIITLSIITYFYAQIRDNVYVARALVGVRAAVPPIIAFAAVKLKKMALRDRWGYLIAGAALCLCLFTKISNVLIILLGAVAGVFITEVKHRDLS